MPEPFEALREYIAIIVGLMAGAVAHFGARLTGEDPMTFKQMAGYSMQLGLVGLMAAVSTRLAGIESDDFRALTAAIMAVSANEIVQWAKREGWLPFAQRIAPAAQFQETQTPTDRSPNDE